MFSLILAQDRDVWNFKVGDTNCMKLGADLRRYLFMLFNSCACVRVELLFLTTLAWYTT